MALNFPSNPTIGDEYSAGGFSWTWNGSSWEKISASEIAVPGFTLSVGTSGNTTYVLDKEYPAGAYQIDFANNDASYDIYFIDSSDNYVGYANGVAAIVNDSFSKISVIGAASNEVILFNYQGIPTLPTSSGDVVTAGAFISSIQTSSLPNIDDSTVITGGNFASDVQVVFIGQNSVSIPAKNIVRNSSTQLLVTRPDSFSTSQSPYSVRVTNPGIPVPSGTNAHISSNSVTAGTNPSWSSSTTQFYALTGTTSIQLSASDTENSDIDYSIVSGTLPIGLTLDQETGLISGTFSGSASDGQVTTVTIRATDAGGNFVDRTFSLTASQPVSGGTVTTSGGFRYHTFTSSSTLEIRFNSRSVQYLIVAGGGGASDNGGGGGAGGYLSGTSTLAVGSYPITVGGGGASATSSTASSGTNSTFNGLAAIGGGNGARYQSNNPGSGGSGGGGASPNESSNGFGGAGTAGQGNSGGTSTPSFFAAGGGGGGAGGVGLNTTSSIGANGGPGSTWLDGVIYAAGGAGGSGFSGASGGVGGSGVGGGTNGLPRANSGSGGGARSSSGNPSSSQSGASGIVIVRYAV